MSKLVVLRKMATLLLFASAVAILSLFVGTKRDSSGLAVPGIPTASADAPGGSSSGSESCSGGESASGSAGESAAGESGGCEGSSSC